MKIVESIDLRIVGLHIFFMINVLELLGTNSKKKHVIFSDIVTIAFDPHPP